MGPIHFHFIFPSRIHAILISFFSHRCLKATLPFHGKDYNLKSVLYASRKPGTAWYQFTWREANSLHGFPTFSFEELCGSSAGEGVRPPVAPASPGRAALQTE